MRQALGNAPGNAPGNALGISLASLRLTLSPPVNSTPTTAASLLLLQRGRHHSTSGPLHLLFSCLECSFPEYPNGPSLAPCEALFKHRLLKEAHLNCTHFGTAKAAALLSLPIALITF